MKFEYTYKQRVTYILVIGSAPLKRSCVFTNSCMVLFVNCSSSMLQYDDQNAVEKYLKKTEGNLPNSWSESVIFMLLHVKRKPEPGAG